MYIALEVQTTETIAAGRNALSTLSVLMNVCPFLSRSNEIY